jgi:hypothetical protein
VRLCSAPGWHSRRRACPGTSRGQETKSIKYRRRACPGTLHGQETKKRSSAQEHNTTAPMFDQHTLFQVLACNPPSWPPECIIRVRACGCNCLNTLQSNQTANMSNSSRGTDHELARQWGYKAINGYVCKMKGQQLNTHIHTTSRNMIGGITMGSETEAMIIVAFHVLQNMAC